MTQQPHAETIPSSIARSLDTYFKKIRSQKATSKNLKAISSYIPSSDTLHSQVFSRTKRSKNSKFMQDI